MPKCHCGNNEFYCTQIATRIALCNGRGDILDDADMDDKTTAAEQTNDNAMDIRPHQRAVWNVISAAPRGWESWLISTPRRFGKNYLAVRRALKSRCAVIVVPGKLATDVVLQRVKQLALGAYLVMERRDYGYLVTLGEPRNDLDRDERPTIIITNVSGLLEVTRCAFLRAVDFLCFLESPHMDYSNQFAMGFAHILANSAMIVHMATVPYRMREDSLFSRSVTLKTNHMRITGPLPDVSDEELKRMLKDMTVETYRADVLGLAPWGPGEGWSCAG